MSTPISLAEALTAEHHEIDGGIERVAETGSGAGDDWVAPLLGTLAALRRHIYLEEELVFPPLSAGPLQMPIMVMLREHGEMWRRMDALEELVTGDDAAAHRERAQAECAELLALLADHNSKEEPVIYPHVDADLDDDAQAYLHDFLATGTTPDGWAAARAAG